MAKENTDDMFKSADFNPSSGLKRLIKTAANDMHSWINDLKELQTNEKYATAAFEGGDRTIFGDKKALRSHYERIRNDKRGVVEPTAARFVEQLEDRINVDMRIDPNRIDTMNSVLSVITDNSQLVRYFSTKQNRDYTALLTVAAFARDNKTMPTATAIATRLQEFEGLCAEMPIKARKFLTRAIVEGHQYSQENWASWLDDRADAIDAAYQKIQDACDGERVDMMDALAQGVA